MSTVIEQCKSRARKLSSGAALCGIPIGGVGSVDLMGLPARGESLSLALALAAFIGAGVWIFRRRNSASQGASIEEPAASPAKPERERELVNA